MLFIPPLEHHSFFVFFGLMGSAHVVLYFSITSRLSCRPLSVGDSSRRSSAYSRNFTSVSCSVSPDAEDLSRAAASSFDVDVGELDLDCSPALLLGPAAGSAWSFSHSPLCYRCFQCMNS